MARPNRKNSAQNRQRSGTTPPSPNAAAEKLAELLLAKQTIPYHENIPDKEFSYITWSIYGAPATNELFVKLTNGTTTFVEATPSDLLSPPMADRIFGIDVSDHNTALRLSERMWKKHRKALVFPNQK